MNSDMNSNTDSNPSSLDHRLTNLEVKATYTEDLLEQLEQVVIRQQQQIENLGRQLTALQQASTQAGPGVPLSLRDELPPHF